MGIGLKVAGAALVIAAGAGVVAFRAGTFGIVNVPGPITGPAALGNAAISGSFRGKPALNGESGQFGGGACLVFQAAEAAPQSCEADAQCAVSLERSGAGGQSLGVYGYCISEAPGVQGQCWYKPFPDAQHCVKGVDINGLSYQVGPVDPYPLGTHVSVQWRVLTCQNLKPAGCAGGVEGDGKRTRYGNVRVMTPSN